MRSRAARFTFSVAAWFSLGASALVLVALERQTADGREAFRTFDARARETADMLSDLRVGQQAYVATGQGVGFWMPKVGATMDATAEAITLMRRMATSPDALAALDEAAAHIADLRTVDDRAREYLRNGQPLMAGDVVFTEGDQTTVRAARAVERARMAERGVLDTAETRRRRIEAVALGAAAGIVTVVVLLLMPAAAAGPAADVPAGEDATEGVSPVETAEAPAPEPPPERAPRAPSSLADVAGLCTDLGRVRDADELKRLLSRTADIMNASGLVVWLGDVSGADLRPALAHGYSASALERMARVPRSADNAAAAAYRTGSLQIVGAKPGVPIGAIVAPILAADGCVGALSAEIRGGAETSDRNQALAALVAAHLASVLTPAPPASPSEPASPDAGRNQAAAG